MSRNRLKSDQGPTWLTVPVKRKGLGLQGIPDVEIFTGKGWRSKHLRTIGQLYARSPYLDRYFSEIQAVYETEPIYLIELNLALIRLLWSILTPDRDLILQSELGVEGRGPDLIVNICDRLGATDYLAFPMAVKYLDEAALSKSGIRVKKTPFYAPVYPQLWGRFLPNLSALDLVLNCGPASSGLLAKT